jgi:hypothetical protein
VACEAESRIGVIILYPMIAVPGLCVPLESLPPVPPTAAKYLTILFLGCYVARADSNEKRCQHSPFFSTRVEWIA